MKIAIVGGGISGCTAARLLAEQGHEITIFESRETLGGNCADKITDVGSSCVNVHSYGPHIFHTSDQWAIDFLSRFTDWIDYPHSVSCIIFPKDRDRGRFKIVPFPVNITTINEVFGLSLSTEEQMKAFLDTKKVEHDQITNSRELIESRLGVELCNLFYAPYTKKMWNLDLEDLEASVAARVPYRTNFDTEYFDSAHIAMPRYGYSVLFSNLTRHKNISVYLKTNIQINIQHPWASVAGAFDHCFYSGPIDSFYNECYGRLRYRSLKFTNEAVSDKTIYNRPVTNFTDDGKYTRVSNWMEFPCDFNINNGETILTYEEPCDSIGSDDKFYPIKSKNADEAIRLAKYQKLAKRDKDLFTFIGRLGGYRYVDMDVAMISVKEKLENMRLI